MDAERIMSASGKLMEAIADNSALQSVLVGDYVDDAVNNRSVSKLIGEVMKEKLASSNETQIKKVLASAISIAEQNGVLPTEMSFDNSVDIAKAVDTAVTRVKTTYQNGAGLMSATEVAEALIDKAAAQLTISVDKAFETGLVNEMIANAIVGVCTYIGLPQAAAYKPLIKQTIQIIEPTLRNVVKKGVVHCREFAKSAIRQSVAAAKNYASKLMTKNLA